MPTTLPVMEARFLGVFVAARPLRLPYGRGVANRSTNVRWPKALFPWSATAGASTPPDQPLNLPASVRFWLALPRRPREALRFSFFLSVCAGQQFVFAWLPSPFARCPFRKPGTPIPNPPGCPCDHTSLSSFDQNAAFFRLGNKIRPCSFQACVTGSAWAARRCALATLFFFSFFLSGKRNLSKDSLTTAYSFFSKIGFRGQQGSHL